MSQPPTDSPTSHPIHTEHLHGILQKVLLREQRLQQLLSESMALPEFFWVLGLAHNRQLLFIELLAQSRTERHQIEPMDVFALALQKRAAQLLLFHSHPNGQPLPSEIDKELTDRLIQVGNIVKIPLLDYQIITPNTFYSFRTSGLLAALQQSLKYVPNFELVQRIQQQAQDLLSQRSAEAAQRLKEWQAQFEAATNKQLQQEKLRMAKALQKEGLELEVIARILGVGKGDLEKL